MYRFREGGGICRGLPPGGVDSMEFTSRLIGRGLRALIAIEDSQARIMPAFADLGSDDINAWFVRLRFACIFR